MGKLWNLPLNIPPQLTGVYTKCVRMDGFVLTGMGGHQRSCPKPFKCSIVPRSERAERLIRSVDE